MFIRCWLTRIGFQRARITRRVRLEASLNYTRRLYWMENKPKIWVYFEGCHSYFRKDEFRVAVRREGDPDWTYYNRNTQRRKKRQHFKDSELEYLYRVAA